MRSAPKLNPEYVIDVNGAKKAVILSIEEYEELIEDLRDLAVIAERREEPVIPHADVMEDIGLAQAIQEGRNTAVVGKDAVLKALE